MNWTDDELATLQAMWNDGKTFLQIADALGTTRSAVAGKVWRLKLPHRAERKPKVKRRRIRRSLARGKPMEKPIAEKASKPVVASKPVSFFDLKDHHCRFPIDGIGYQIRFCGAPAAKGYPYCAAHCAVAYHRPVPRTKGEIELIVRDMRANDKIRATSE